MDFGAEYGYEGFTYIDFIAILVAVVPILVGLLIWIVFYYKSNVKVLKVLEKDFSKVSAAAENLKACSMKNLQLLDAALYPPTSGSKKDGNTSGSEGKNKSDKSSRTEFDAAWKRMMIHGSSRYTEEIIPDGESFFPKEALLMVPAGRDSIKYIWGSIAALAVFALWLTPVFVILLGSQFPLLDAIGGLAAAGALVIIHLLFTALDLRGFRKAEKAYHRFLYAFDTALPTASGLAGPALLLDATRKNQKAFEEMSASMKDSFRKSTDKITKSIDEFTKGGVLPAIEDAMRELIEGHIVPSTEDMKNKVNETLDKASAAQSDAIGIMKTDIANTLITVSEKQQTSMADISKQMADILRTVAERQESGMKELAYGFAARLSDTLQMRMDRIGEAMEEYQARMDSIAVMQQKSLEEYSTRYESMFEEQGKKYQTMAEEHQNRIDGQNADYVNRMQEQNKAYLHKLESLSMEEKARTEERNSEYQRLMDELNKTHQKKTEDLNGILAGSMEKIASFTEGQSESMNRTEALLAKLEAIQGNTAETASQLQNGLADMVGLTVKMQNQSEEFSNDVKTITEKSAQAQVQFSELVKDITGQMQRAMADAGREIAEGINKAVEDNAKAIADLTEQSQALRDDYEVFFTRNEETTKNTLEEMDYQVQGIIMRISEEIGTMMESSITRNGEILSQYKDQTADILASFDEQARSIGLYAKEINMDITELSHSLGSAVTEFNEKMREGLGLAISEFDSGLAELTSRIANTVESIAEAVEALPEKIRG